jgi:hypothetical protein
LNESGVIVDRVDAAKTEEQLRQEAEMERLRKERERLVQKQKDEDRVLLRTFRSEDDILLTRDGQLQAVDGYITITKSNIKRLKLKLEALQRDAAAIELSGRRIPAKLKQELDSKNTALKEAYQSIINQERDKDRIRKAFAKDLSRFRELKQLAETSDPLAEAKQSFFAALQNVYNCGEDVRCDLPWEKARAYMRTHNTTKITMDADNIIVSAAPMADDDISITLTRLKDNQRKTTLIFLDVQCKDTVLGNTLCQSGQVRAIIESFQTAIAPIPNS